MCFANSAFLALFEHTRVRYIASMESDHCFVLAELRERLSNGTHSDRRFGMRMFGKHIWIMMRLFYSTGLVDQVSRDYWVLPTPFKGSKGS
jgi:hypothetical protein